MIGAGRVGAVGRSRAAGLILPPDILLAGSAFDDAAWTPEQSGVGELPVVEADAAEAPDGTMTADRVTFSLGGGSAGADISWLAQNQSGVLIVGVGYRSRLFGRVASGTATLIHRHAGGGGFGLIELDTTWRSFDRVETATGSALNFQLGLRGNFGASAEAVVELWGAELRQVT